MKWALLAVLIGFAGGTDDELYSTYFARAEKAKAAGDYAAMERNLILAHRHGRGNEYSWRSLSWAQMNQGKWRQALANATENIRKHGETSWSLKQLFYVASSIGDLDLAKHAVLREAALPREKRNASMEREQQTLRALTEPTVLEIDYRIAVDQFERQEGKLYLQAPLAKHLWQKAKTAVSGAKAWRLFSEGRWNVLEIDPGDAKEIVVHSTITHTPRPIGWKALEQARSNTIPPSLRKYTGKFINGSSYDPADPLLKDLVPGLLGRSVAETVQNILDWLAQNMRYEFGHSDRLEDMLQSKRGVCHHYSNLMVVLCRAAGVPALVAHGDAMPISGTFKDISPSHGWVEVYIPEFGWTPVDPLNPGSLRCFRGAGYVIVDTSSHWPEDNHFSMKLKNGRRLQSIQAVPASGTARQVGS